MPRASLKEQIVAAGLQTLHRNGFNGCSVQDITEAAGVPKGSFYNHFASKDDLAIAALDRYWDCVESSFDIITEPGVAPLARLARYFRRLNDIARDNRYETGCFVGNMSAELSGQSPAIRERLAGLLRAWSQAIETCVREAQSDGSMRRDLDAGSVAAFLINAWEGAMMRAKVDRSHTALADFETIALATLSI